jgi:hypothetical protein
MGDLLEQTAGAGAVSIKVDTLRELLHRAMRSPDPQLCCDAVGLAGKVRDYTSVQLLRRCLRNPAAIYHAAYALEDLGESPIGDLLTITQGKGPLRLDAIACLAYLDSREARHTLYSLANAGAGELSLAAAVQLYQKRARGAAIVMKRILNDAHADAKIRLAGLLARETRACRPPLLRLLRDEDVRVRASALRNLTALMGDEDPRATAVVIGRLAKDESPLVRNAARKALARLQKSKATAIQNREQGAAPLPSAPAGPSEGAR